MVLIVHVSNHVFKTYICVDMWIILAIKITLITDCLQPNEEHGIAHERTGVYWIFSRANQE